MLPASEQHLCKQRGIPPHQKAKRGLFMQIKTDSNRPAVLPMSRTSHNEVLSPVLVQNGYDGNLQQLNN